MLPTYETERLIMRARTLDDLDACLAMDLDPEVVKYIRPTPPEAEHRIFLHESITRHYGDGLGFWSVFEKTIGKREGSFVGWVLLVPLAGEGPEVEIGYRFVQRAWGKGYATEAASAIRDHAFRKAGLEAICGVTAPNNAASQHVLQKVGLSRKGTRLAYGLDLPFFLLEKENWSASRADKEQPGLG
ncbi:GNAT family N-acetyltransferase [uncultured Cohaesibacter sp.]|uniref:GNAT family N-acetyltransferase n=1 Tax=uncultured Cohaesibacter sp. TaxID=1002546 RepID=UPI002AA7A157|nr:GNAT family N-acetyltransferase [uncultured Cohaesibacter sp.]